MHDRARRTGGGEQRQEGLQHAQRACAATDARRHLACTVHCPSITLLHPLPLAPHITLLTACASAARALGHCTPHVVSTTL